MEKIFIEANYQIPGFISNNGYICISDNYIMGIFTFDCVSIEIKEEKLHFYLAEYAPEYNSYKQSNEFISYVGFDYLECPYMYLLKSHSNVPISLKLIRKVTNPIEISKISKNFKAFPE